MQSDEPHLSPWEGNRIILEALTKHIKDTRVNENNHHGFIKVKSCLVNLVAFLL